MRNTREKLKSLLMQKGFGVEGATIAADHLIENGVTVQTRPCTVQGSPALFHRWVTIEDIHDNTNNLDAFYWYQGELYLVFNSDPKPLTFDDPYRQLYLRLCRQQGVQPVEADEDG